MTKRASRLGSVKKQRLKEVIGPDDGEFGVHPSIPPQSQKSGNSINPSYSKQKWLELFLDFIGNLSIDSKDLGVVRLKDELFGAQYRFLEGVCAGLEDGVRHFVVLKARQLGISTVSLAMDLFWLAVHPGMQGALITDTEGNKEKFRIIIDRYLESLPAELKIGVKTSNRNNLVLTNGSVLDYLVAGVRKSGGLGRSRAYNFVHATECSSWGDPEGVASLMASLSESHPDRLYIFESTARGFNLFHDMWRSARGDRETQRPIFIGWWAKETYSVPAGGDLYQKYWDGILSPEEQEKYDKCETQYGVKVKPEQIAWYRWKEQTRMTSDGTMASEFPWTEQEAFVATGRGFFPVKQVAMNIQEIYERLIPFEGYTYWLGDEFVKTECKKVNSIAEADLRVWEYPNEKGYYAIGVDPAYGRDADNDRSVIQVWRCYADRIVQVAEYATPIPETHHLAWVLCHLAGNYRNCMINLELQGPGVAVMQELNHLKQMMQRGYMDTDAVRKDGLQDFITQARYFLYHRPDSMGAGYVYNWKTTSENKQLILNQMRDLYMTKQLEIRSIPLLEEMQTVVQDGVEIKGSGTNKDDRTFATALALKAYIEWIRKPLVDAKKTFDNAVVEEKNAKSPYKTFMQGIVEDHYANMKHMRGVIAAQQAWEEGWGDADYD